MGHMEQEYEGFDENGNKKYLFLKEVYDEDGNLVNVIKTTEKTGRKSLMWQGDRFEGLFYSLALTIRDALTGDLKTTPVQRKRRALVGLHDLLIGFLLAALVRVMLEDFKDEDQTSVVANTKMLTTNAFYKATREFDPINSIFQAFQ